MVLEGQAAGRNPFPAPSQAGGMLGVLRPCAGVAAVLEAFGFFAFYRHPQHCLAAAAGVDTIRTPQGPILWVLRANGFMQ